MRAASWGHAFFAVTMIALGIIGLITGDFTATWTGVPKSVPLRETLAYLCAVVSLLSGIGLLLQRTAGIASRVLLVYLLGWLLLVRVPHIFMAPAVLDSWWGCGDTAVMVAATWVLYAWFAADQDARRFGLPSSAAGVRMARVFYGLALIPFGIAHLVNPVDTASLVPGWLPWHVGFVYFTACAFIAAAIAVLFNVYARLAATLSAWQIGLFTLLVWVPVVIRGPNAFQWSEFIDSWTLTAGAWMVADSYRRSARATSTEHP